ncbi:MAG TPA: hypothetical protein VK249_34665 [Anaerolineales bacterium]|nr:hypothetical protein [Anaerolineales bacterium]
MLGVIGILLSSCTNGSNTRSDIIRKTLPENTGYLVSGLNENLNFAGNAMMVFDSTDFSKIRESPLPKSRIETAKIAPDGNLWLGLSGGSTREDNRVVVLDTAGNELSEIHACLSPTAGIWFYNHSAIIVCRDTGFYATITEINMSSFTVERKLQIKISDQQPFMAVSSGLSGSSLGVIGLTAGPQEALTYSILSIVNLDTFSVSAMMDLGAGTNIWSVLPYEGRFVLLNAQGRDDPKKRDMIWVTPNDHEIEKAVTLPTPSPLWGVIADEVLYSFHNSSWNSISVTPDRFLCSTNLVTYQQSCLQLPEHFDSYGMEVVGGNPCITHWGEEGSSGLYCLENGKLELKIKYEAASLVVLSTRE